MNFDLFALEWGLALWIALAIFVILQFGKKLGLVGEDDFARIANLVLAYLLSGASPDSPESIALMALASTFAAALYKIYAWVKAKYFPNEDEDESFGEVGPGAGAH